MMATFIQPDRNVFTVKRIVALLLIGLLNCSSVLSIKLGSKCQHDMDCTDFIKGSSCSVNGYCECAPYFVQLNDSSCLSSQLLGGDCKLNEQCTMKVANSSCLDGACRCVEGFLQFRKHTCLGPAHPSSVCYSHAHCQMFDSRTHCDFLIPNLFGRCGCTAPARLHGGSCMDANQIAEQEAQASSSTLAVSSSTSTTTTTTTTAKTTTTATSTTTSTTTSKPLLLQEEVIQNESSIEEQDLETTRIEEVPALLEETNLETTSQVMLTPADVSFLNVENSDNEITDDVVPNSTAGITEDYPYKIEEYDVEQPEEQQQIEQEIEEEQKILQAELAQSHEELPSQGDNEIVEEQKIPQAELAQSHEELPSQADNEIIEEQKIPQAELPQSHEELPSQGDSTKFDYENQPEQPTETEHHESTLVENETQVQTNQDLSNEDDNKVANLPQDVIQLETETPINESKVDETKPETIEISESDEEHNSLLNHENESEVNDKESPAKLEVDIVPAEISDNVNDVDIETYIDAGKPSRFDEHVEDLIEEDIPKQEIQSIQNNLNNDVITQEELNNEHNLQIADQININTQVVNPDETKVSEEVEYQTETIPEEPQTIEEEQHNNIVESEDVPSSVNNDEFQNEILDVTPDTSESNLDVIQEVIKPTSNEPSEELSISNPIESEKEIIEPETPLETLQQNAEIDVIPATEAVNILEISTEASLVSNEEAHISEENKLEEAPSFVSEEITNEDYNKLNSGEYEKQSQAQVAIIEEENIIEGAEPILENSSPEKEVQTSETQNFENNENPSVLNEEHLQAENSLEQFNIIEAEQPTTISPEVMDYVNLEDFQQTELQQKPAETNANSQSNSEDSKTELPELPSISEEIEKNAEDAQNLMENVDDSEFNKAELIEEKPIDNFEESESIADILGDLIDESTTIVADEENNKAELFVEDSKQELSSSAIQHHNVNEDIPDLVAEDSQINEEHVNVADDSHINKEHVHVAEDTTHVNPADKLITFYPEMQNIQNIKDEQQLTTSKLKEQESTNVQQVVVEEDHTLSPEELPFDMSGDDMPIQELQSHNLIVETSTTSPQTNIVANELEPQNQQQHLEEDKAELLPSNSQQQSESLQQAEEVINFEQHLQETKDTLNVDSEQNEATPNPSDFVELTTQTMLGLASRVTLMEPAAPVLTTLKPHLPEDFVTTAAPKTQEDSHKNTSGDNAALKPIMNEIRKRVELALEAVSLGLTCYNDRQCQLADPNTVCNERKVCDCAGSKATDLAKCGAERTGCSPGTFQCRSSGVCISWFFVCDGRSDCTDGSDEECNIKARHNQTCPIQAFHCAKSGRCISRAALCDGRKQCPHGEDEIGCNKLADINAFAAECPAHTFRCKSGECLPEYEFCNAIISCKDGSDEPPHLCGSRHVPNFFLRLLTAGGLMGGNNDATAYCPHKCSNGRCRSTAIVCSGRDGCGDGTDEQTCSVCRCPAPTQRTLSQVMARHRPMPLW